MRTVAARRLRIALITIFGVSLGLVVTAMVWPSPSTPRLAPIIYREVVDDNPAPPRAKEYPFGAEVADRILPRQTPSESNDDPNTRALTELDRALASGRYGDVLDAYRKLVGDDATYALRLELLKRMAQLPVRTATKLLLEAAGSEDASVRGRQLAAHAGQLLSRVWASDPSWLIFGRDSLEQYRDRPRAQEALVVAIRTAAVEEAGRIDVGAFEADLRLAYDRTQDDDVRAAVILSAGELWDVSRALAFLREVVDGEWRSYTSVVTYPLADLVRKDASGRHQVVAILTKLATRPEIDRGAFLRVVETIEHLDPSSLDSLAAGSAVRDRGLTKIIDAVVAQRSLSKGR